MSKIKKIIAILCVCAVFVCIPVTASAVVTDYGYVSIPVLEPQLLGNNTVVELLVTDSNGAYHAVMFNFSAFPTDTTLPTRFDLAISTTAIKANGVITGNGAGTLSCMMVRDDGYVSYQSILNQTDNDRDFYFSFGTSSYQTILGYKVYGNFGEVSVDSRVKNQEFNFIYGADNVQYGQLQAILGAVNGLGNISGQITANQNQNTDKVTNNQNQNTDKIIENQQQLQENEKNEAESSGQGSVNDVSGAIEDKSAGFISAISNLVGSMSYNGTACAWSFPAIKLPAIEGVMPEYQLTEEQPIDFEFWVNKIPADILLLVRSLLTIALIVFCFKELYGTISYVLTLKGGGNNE